jgi:low temperature requirement protein LtrA
LPAGAEPAGRRPWEGFPRCEDGQVITTLSSRVPRVSAVMREGERVTPLELFFGLVFVLALTQCTTLMAGTPTWMGLLKGLLVLGMLWWSWVGYAWLTSVVDPEEGAVRLAMFAAMAPFLVAALCVPGAFGSEALLFACAYGAVRTAHIVLFMLASREDPPLRRSVLGLATSTAIGAGMLFIAAFAVVLLALVPAGTSLPALVTLAVLAGLLAALIAYEALRYAEARDHVRQELVG